MTLTFKGNWPDEYENGELAEDSPVGWETFEIRLFGTEAGDFVDDPEEVKATLARAGLKIVKKGVTDG